MLTILLLLQTAMAMTPGEGKGTIGIVCVDSEGVSHFWNSRAKAEGNRTDFEACVDQIVQTWNLSRAPGACDPMESSCDPSAADRMINNLIGGYSTYKKAADIGFKQFR